MKLFITFFSLVILIIIYLYKTNPYFNNMYYIINYQNLSSVPSILKKDINKLNNLEKEYKEVKLKPNIYALYLKFNYKYYPSSWNKIKSVKANYYKILSKLIIKNSKGEEVYSKQHNILGSYGWLEYIQILKLHKFNINKTDIYTINLKIIENNLQDLPNDLLFLDLKVDVSL